MTARAGPPRMLEGVGTYLWFLLALVYLSILAAQNLTKAAELRKGTAALKAELAGSLRERDRMQALTVYYRTPSFQEKELRRTLLLKRPGEQVFMLPESGVRQAEAAAAADAAKKSDPAAGLPTWRQWMLYFNGDLQR